MAEDKPLKSAYELAMERLRAKDRADGVEQPGPLSQAQKKKIARLRREAEAKLAEIEIMHRKALAEAGGDPAKAAELEERRRIDRERVESRLDSALARVRRGESPAD